MTVHIIYKKTGEKVASYYNCEEITKDIGCNSCTLKFARDTKRDITIFSPLTFRLDKFDLLIESY